MSLSRSLPLLAAILLLCISLLNVTVFATFPFFPHPMFRPHHHSSRPIGHHRKAGKIAREFLEAHNKYRIRYNLPLLEWDPRLVRHARRWGAQQAAHCQMIHSNSPYGENIFWAKYGHNWPPKRVVKSWADEKQNYNMKTNQCDADKTCGHFTQIVWLDSARVGCAKTRCHNGEMLVFCNYDPPGNYLHSSPFVHYNHYIPHVAFNIHFSSSMTRGITVPAADDQQRKL